MGLLDQLQSFGQGASNSAASNVTAPVDGLAWLLRKMGVPVPSDPVGGSDWAAKQGLTATPKNHVAGLLGEAIGGVAPMLAAAKAPQIARGLLQMEANAAAPKTLNPQTGAIVWHGSPHKFDKFDSSKIGTGEGAQAYGHGLYLAESPDVATSYIPTNEAGKSAIAKQLQAEAKRAARYSNEGGMEVLEMFNKGYTPQAIRNNIDNIISDGSVHPSYAKKMNQAYEKGMQIYKQNSGGSLYKVDLPDEHIAKMLDWDKPLSEQPQIRGMIQKDLEDILSTDRNEMPWTYGKKADDMTGEDLVRSFASIRGTYAGASDLLKEGGIPGIRYLDGGSRGAGQGSSNFVVFPGNEGLLSILERNGQSLK